MLADSTARCVSRRRRQWATSCLLLVACTLLVLAGCSGADAPLSPVHRLADELNPPLDQVPLHCDIADDFRPTIGCVAIVLTASVQDLPRSGAATVTIPITIPKGVKADLLVLEPSVRAPKEQWSRLPRVLIPFPPGGKTELTVSVPEAVKADKVDAQVYLRPVPVSHQQRVTRPLAIGRGAVLSLALGLDAIGRQVGASAVDFRVLAQTRQGTSEILRERLDPAQAATWESHTVDLQRFAGETVSFRLITDVVGQRPGLGPSAVGFPLWGSVQILEPRAREGRRNVVLISLDTLRGDQLGGRLDGQPIMPKLDARAARGARFTKAYTTYPSTTAGHMSMLTGLYAASHGMVFATGNLSRDITTLPQILAQHGYATAAVTENAMLSAYVGFVRGFDDYREVKGKTLWSTAGEIEQTFGAGLDWVEKHRDERFFLFLHTYQVHSPYEPPSEFDVFKHWEKDGQRVPIDGSTPMGVRERHLYSGEARYADAAVDRLLQRLDDLGVLDDTIVVVTSDHGDEFFEHGLFGHAKTVFEEVMHVPLMILSPRLVPASQTIDVPVSLVDLVPTLLDLVRVPAPPGLHGRSLVPLLHGEPFPATRVLYAEAPQWGQTGERVAARSAGFKWIAGSDAEHGTKVYDLTTDPDEQTPLDDPALIGLGSSFEAAYRGLARKRETTTAAGAAKGATPGAAEKPQLDDATLKKLKALGYMD